MKKTIHLFCVIITLFTTCNQQPDDTSKLKTFAKAYGYIKYFHPSDEASKIDWNQFAAYGAEQVLKTKNKTELIQTLNSLFQPIAPSVVFFDKKQKFDLRSITPKDTADLQNTFWQHEGVSKDMSYKNYVYKSVRVNSFSEIDESSSYGNLTLALDHKKLGGKEVKYTAWVKLKEGTKGTGHLWFRVNKADKSLGFFDNMGANPITSNQWQKYEITGKIDDNPSGVSIGSYLMGKGALILDDAHVYYKEKGKWIEVSLANNDFEKPLNGKKGWIGTSKGYSYDLTNSEPKEGKSSLEIAYQGLIKKVKGEAVFEGNPAFGELIEEEISSGIYCQIPLNLYIKEGLTYPKSESFSTFQTDFEQLDFNDNSLAMRLGNVINTFNVIQHFFPYFDVVDVNWEKEFETAIQRSFSDSTSDDHLITIQKMMASLKDGHAKAWSKNAVPYVLPIQLEWIKDQLVVTEVIEEGHGIKIGDIVSKINNQAAQDYFKEIFSRITAGNQGAMAYKSQLESVIGKKDDSLSVEINGKNIPLSFSIKYTYSEPLIAVQKDVFKKLENNIYYLNLNDIDMKTYTSLNPELKQAKGIIYDMRGYPNSTITDIISHLIQEKDTSNAWLQTPHIIYPNQKKLVGYKKIGWGIEPKEPYLGDKKNVFIIDGSAVSYAESIMSYIEAYDLATIVGQPTAGANGNMNPFNILGGIGVNWTGMKVLKHDGSQFHTIGILPDVYVEKTIEGVRAGKDELFDKAVELALE